MRPEAHRLRDILDAADEIAEYVRRCDAEDFAEDTMRRRAVERLLTIIGEAAKQLPDDTRAAIDQPWREIIRFRDKGVHAYDALSPRTVYAIATVSVPRLRDAVAEFLSRS